ncbi:MAG: penicillin acylase family protein [bacterium]|jgi:acyl-homoserine lactone acylase PvdQ
MNFTSVAKPSTRRGVGVPGSPIILIGWNENVAWGMTALGADQADQFFLTTDPERPNQYQFNGEWRKMKVVNEIIKVKDGKDIRLSIRESHLGPVVNEIAHDVRPHETVALKRVPMAETDRDTIQGALAMMRAKDVNEFAQALEGWRIPSANVLFGDKKGNIGYWAVGAIPVRSRYALEDGNATHDGSDSKYDWQGMLPHQLLPHVINPGQGFLYSGNHRPVESFYPLSIGISTGSMGDSDRSWRLRERLRAKEVFSPSDVLDIHYDCTNPARREIVHIALHMRDVLNIDLPEDVEEALQMLEPWYHAGASSDLSHPGAEVATLFPTMFRILQTPLAELYGGGNSGLTYFAKTVQQRIEKDPKAPIDPLEQEYVLGLISQAWARAKQMYRGEPETWNRQARKEVTQRTLEYQSTLDGFSSFDTEQDIHLPELTCVDGGTIKSQAAQSYSSGSPCMTWIPPAPSSP